VVDRRGHVVAVKRLIVNADDLGYAASIDAGILRAHRDGIVTAATMMANVAGTVPAAELARATPSLDVGVHLVLTHGRPISDPGEVPSLVDERGAFLRPKQIVGTGRVRTEDALREFRAQFARARDLLGRRPSHVDAHHWVEDDPAVLEAFVAVARETGSAARCLTRTIRDRLRGAGVRTPDGYTREFQHDGHIDAASLFAILGSLTDGVTELGCHPGERDPHLERRSSYARERSIELATLTDPAARERVAELGIELVTFADL
jgi:hypothetical protein